jgi:MoaA/NifB/PqqE/SkfB family radical SAM enzyme
VKNYEHKPAEYPDMKYYRDNEMSTDFVLDTLMKLKEHNPDMFHLWYGGEPLLRNDLAEIINFCNSQDINYTIISNNCDEIDPLFQKLMNDEIKGYTASIDPIVMACSDSIKKTDRYKKSKHGFRKLIELSKEHKIKDLVAEMTVCKDDVEYISETIYELKLYDIATDITFVDVAKNVYYDFSNVRGDRSSLVKPSIKLARELIKAIDWDFNVHMPELYERVFEILPSNLDCGLDKNIHNITIDADGSMRLCLRIKGMATPKLKANKIIQNGIISPILEEFIALDLHRRCEGCNWTCVLMSQMLEEGSSNVNSLVHLEKRGD